MKDISSHGEMSALVVANKATDLLSLRPKPPGQAGRTPGRSNGRSELDARLANFPLGEPISIRQVAQLIGCSVWSVRQRHIPQGLPHFRSKPSGKLIFYHDQVVAWILENQIQERRTS